MATLPKGLETKPILHRLGGVAPRAGTQANLQPLLTVEEFADAEWWEEAVAHLPGGKAAVDGDMANAIDFLASPRAGYVSGAVLTIDGGVSTRRAVIYGGSSLQSGQSQVE